MKLKEQNSKLKGSPKGQAPVEFARLSDVACIGVAAWTGRAGGYLGIGNF